MHILSSLALASAFVVQVLSQTPCPVLVSVYMGCYIDPVNPRALPIMGQVVGPTTVESCVAACNNQGYTIAGLEYGFQCFCGSGLQNLVLSQDNGCNMPCAGDPDEMCGGPSRLDVYSIVSL